MNRVRLSPFGWIVAIALGFFIASISIGVGMLSGVFGNR